MDRRVAYQAAAVVGLAIMLSGCGFGFFGYEQRAAWRDREERVCMASRPPVVFSAWVQPERSIDGRGACGILYPLKVSALEDGSIRVGPSATLGCPMTTMLEDWFRNAVQPAAMAWFGAPVVQIKQLSNYACRSIDSIPGKQLSEHAFGNAIDIASFTLANGREVTVKRGWRGARDEQGFLREVEATACATFKTTLGPGEPYHGDHFHLDLAHHGKSGTQPLLQSQAAGPAAAARALWRRPVRPLQYRLDAHRLGHARWRHDGYAAAGRRRRRNRPVRRLRPSMVR